MDAQQQQATKEVILRAWKDEKYRNSLPTDVREAIPARPQGDSGREMSDSELEAAAGGLTPGAAAIAAGAGKAILTGAVGGAAGWATKEVLE